MRIFRKIDGFAIVVAAAIFFLTASLYFLGSFRGLELKTIDYRFKQRPIQGDCPEVVVVEIGDRCLRELGQWPLRRSVIAAAVDKIFAAGARTLAIDLLFVDSSTTSEDAIFKDSIARNISGMVLAMQLSGEINAEDSAKIKESRVLHDPREILLRGHPAAGVATGLINFDYAGENYDGVLRNVPLVSRQSYTRSYDTTGVVIVDTLEVLSVAALRNFTGKGVSDLGVPPNLVRNSFPVNYNRSYTDSPFPKVFLSDLLAADTAEISEIFKGRLVFFGATASAVPDLRLTPYGLMPGLEVHATIASNILRSSYAYRMGFAEGMAVLVAAFAFLFFYLRRPFGFADLIVYAAVMASYGGLVWFLFVKYRYFADVVPFVFLVTVQMVFTRLVQTVRQVYISNRELKKMVDRLGALYDIVKLSHKQTDLQKLLNQTAVEISRILKCKRVSIVIEDPKSKSLILKAAMGFDNSDRPIENLILNRRSPVISKVMETAEPLLIKNIDNEKEIVKEDSASYRTKSFVCIPLILDTHAIGALSVTDKENNENFTEDDLKTITVFSNQIAGNIEHIFNISFELEKRRLEKELEIASSLQKKLVPSGFKKMSKFEVAGTYIPAKEVSGDYYDCIELDEDRVLLLIGDVSGKGVPAGLFMMMVRTFLHTILKHENDLTRIIGHMNDYLTANSESTMFLTVFMCFLNIRTGDIEYVNGGHMAPILRKTDGTLEELGTQNLICGMFEGVNYELGKASLAPGETLYIYTDGITEAQTETGDMYGVGRLEDVIKTSDHEKGAGDLANAVLDSVKTFVCGAPQSDDITILVVKALKE